MSTRTYDTQIQLANSVLTNSVKTLASEIRILMNQKMARDEEQLRVQQEEQAKKEKGVGSSAKKRGAAATKEGRSRKKAKTKAASDSD